MSLTSPTETIGVVVGRFQVDSLHAGHTHLLSYVAKRHVRLLICLGVTRNRTKRDPLDFMSRAKMLQAAFPAAAVVPLLDTPGNDHQWSATLDTLIRSVYPTGQPILYGARGSFLSSYHGRFQTREIEDGPEVSGTRRRREVAAETRDTEDFRAGQIHAIENQTTPWYPCVDIAILRGSGDTLLGQKDHEVDTGKYRFVGGMVDDTDPTLYSAAKRELAEETGIEADGLEMVGTFIQGEHVKFITTLFAATYVYGSIYHPKDDIAALGWVPLRRLLDYLIPLHQPLGVALLKWAPNLGAPCSTQCTGYRYHQPGCPAYRDGTFIEVPKEKVPA